jgi:hypothetical protein
MHRTVFDRREWMQRAALLASAAGLRGGSARADEPRERLPVAGVVTVYKNNSHADVILGKILRGYDQQGGPGPDLKLVSLYTDQVPANDLSRDLAREHRFRLARSIDEALTLGTNRLQVAGVLSIGEHGQYPDTPDTGQKMYPRKRFFDEITACFRRVGEVVPVFNDKHLSYAWKEARQMADVAEQMQIPFMAGSSLPVTWRRPPLELPLGCEIEDALVVGYGPREGYGFHALEALQCMVERRGQGETGVAAVRVLQGEEILTARDRGDWSEELFESALKTMPERPAGDLNQLSRRAAFYQIEYRDGLRATVAMANGIARQIAFAARIRGTEEPLATWFELEDGKPYGHFGFLVRAIEQMIHSGQPAYPVERTLLTTGILDAVMHSIADGGKRRETPELALRYAPADWPFANQSAE